MKSDMIWTLVAFAFYLAGMLLIGAAYMKKTKSSEDFFLGGRGLNGWVAALSAQASDMSGWMLMGLPGAVYAFGTGQIWIAVGLLIGTILNWAIVSGRLRRYTIRANNSMTLPKYLENRFEDKHKIMLLYRRWQSSYSSLFTQLLHFRQAESFSTLYSVSTTRYVLLSVR